MSGLRRLWAALTAREGAALAVLFALAWGVGPALPALIRGELLGHPYTDLYPSVWGLWGFAWAQPAFPGHTELLGFPGGMGFYYSSPLKGWLAWPLIPLIGLPATWDLLTLAARVGTVLAAWGAARAWGLRGPGALAAAAVYGASPFFQGYAVEGIVEGTDGWTLALWALAVGRRRWGWSILAFAATIWSSWYLGMVVCLLTGLAGLWQRRAWLGFLGLLLAMPALYRFATAFPGAAPLSDAVRASMGARLLPIPPGSGRGLNPFAITTWVGLVTLSAALASRTRWPLLALIPAFLSLGLGPVYHLPVAELVRFPYRWHAGTLLLLAPAVGALADRRGWWWLGPLATLEGLLLGPIEPVIPGSPAEIPEIYASVDRPLLELPGPVAAPPGQVNLSRPRARYLLYYQSRTGQPSPWVPDFNSVGVTTTDGLDAWRAWDPLVARQAPAALEPGAVADLAADGVGYVMVHADQLGHARADALRAALLGQGARLAGEQGPLALFALPASSGQAPGAAPE